MKVREYFLLISVLVTIAIISIALFWQPILWLFLIVAPLILMGLFDIFQKSHTIRRNFPLIGRFRYVLESIRPEIMQYFVETDTQGRPLNRILRSLVYRRAKGENDTEPFGTQMDLYHSGYEWLEHSMYAKTNPKDIGVFPRLMIGGKDCKQPYSSSLLNISAMSFGSLSNNAVLALNKGAKPGHGGILPASKNTEEIAKIRHVKPGIAVHSPPSHSAFKDPIGFMHFIKKLRDLSNGKPIGFKLCLGRKQEFMDFCEAMLHTGIQPDFITVDGGEGGTGAAPVEFSNSMGMPLREGLIFVHDTLVGFGIRKDIKVIVAGKIISGFHMARAIALGADGCNSARAMMLSIGCIQALQCNTNTCPVGVATQNPSLVKGLVVDDKAPRAQRYHEATIHSFLELVAAAGLNSPNELTRNHISKRVGLYDVKTYEEIYPYVEEGSLVNIDTIPEDYMKFFKSTRVM